VFAAEHLLDFALLHLGVEPVETAGQIVGHGLALVRPLEQHGQVVGAPPERLAQLVVLLQAPPALQRLLRRSLVLPEVGCRRLLVQAGELDGQIGVVKDSSAGPRPV